MVRIFARGLDFDGETPLWQVSIMEDVAIDEPFVLTEERTWGGITERFYTTDDDRFFSRLWGLRNDLERRGVVAYATRLMRMPAHHLLGWC